VRKGREHHSVVILEFREFILKSDNFEALSTDLASVNGTLTAHVEHFLMRVSIIFDTRSHTDNNSPGRVRCENEDRVIDSTELRVHGRLHLMPLIQLNSVLSHRGTERSGGVTMKSVAFGHLGFVILTIRLHETLNVLHGGVESVNNLLEHREVRSLLDVHLRLHSLGSSKNVSVLAQSSASYSVKHI